MKKTKKACKHVWKTYTFRAISECASGSYGMERDYEDRYDSIWIKIDICDKCSKKELV